MFGKCSIINTWIGSRDSLHHILVVLLLQATRKQACVGNDVRVLVYIECPPCVCILATKQVVNGWKGSCVLNVGVRSWWSFTIGRVAQTLTAHRVGSIIIYKSSELFVRVHKIDKFPKCATASQVWTSRSPTSGYGFINGILPAYSR